uniref:DUF4260 family protein n=1 Tax=uncultured bacterium 148 TaxID=698380 RepID=E3T6N1_9BACT|nr:hypothetical protein [uncultured bacterium 148]
MTATTMPAATGELTQMAPPSTRAWLRIEGVAVFVAGLALFVSLGGPWFLAIPLLLVPDASAIGYLRGPRVGAAVYNLFHNWAIGLVVLGVGIWSGVGAITLAGTILVAHVGMDRAAGYGLKLPSSFQDTHLGRIGKRR